MSRIATNDPSPGASRRLPRLLSIRAVAEATTIPRPTLYSLISRGDMLSYTANVVVNAVTGHSVVPSATGGIGGLTMFARPRGGL
jgi:hypothetical protein